MATPSTADPILRTVLVTGASSGIGAALVPQLADRGCEVIAAGRDRTRLEEVAAGRERVAIHPGDITDPAHRADLADRVARGAGPRGLVQLAGSFQVGALASLDSEGWRRSFATNVEARWALGVACASALGDGGRMLFIGSDAGRSPRAGAGAYSIAQAASETLRRVFQTEWAGTGRHVGGFKPGLVDTEMVRGFMRLPADEFPARAAYDEYVRNGLIADAATVARFATWLLLDVSTHEFELTEWDIRDDAHHDRWSTSPLYPDAR